MVLALVTGVCWMLMAWPMIIRRFFSERQFADLLAGDDAPIHRRAPDAGLTGLGWLLLAHAMFGATMLIPQLVLGGPRARLEQGPRHARLRRAARDPLAVVERRPGRCCRRGPASS